VVSLSESDLLASPLEDFADATEVMALLSELLTMPSQLAWLFFVLSRRISVASPEPCPQ
jgi:hypothetical protein